MKNPLISLIISLCTLCISSCSTSTATGQNKSKPPRGLGVLQVVNWHLKNTYKYDWFENPNTTSGPGALMISSRDNTNQDIFFNTLDIDSNIKTKKGDIPGVSLTKDISTYFGASLSYKDLPDSLKIHLGAKFEKMRNFSIKLEDVKELALVTPSEVDGLISKRYDIAESGCERTYRIEAERLAEAIDSNKNVFYVKSVLIVEKISLVSQSGFKIELGLNDAEIKKLQKLNVKLDYSNNTILGLTWDKPFIVGFKKNELVSSMKDEIKKYAKCK